MEFHDSYFVVSSELTGIFNEIFNGLLTLKLWQNYRRWSNVPVDCYNEVEEMFGKVSLVGIVAGVVMEENWKKTIDVNLVSSE